MALSLYITHSYTPSLPDISNRFHITLCNSANTVNLYLIGFGISPLIYAPYSDIFGRRPIVLCGLMIALLGSILSTISWSFNMLLLAWLTQGIGMGVVPGIIRCMASDLSKTENHLGRLIHKSGTIFSLTPAISPIIGGYIQYQFGWRFNLLSIVIFTMITTIVAYLYLPETINVKTNKSPYPKLAFKKYFKLFSFPKFILCPLISLASYTGIILYLTYSPYFYQNELHLNSFENGLIGAGATLSIIIGRIINIYILKQRSLVTILAFSGFLQFISGLIMFVQIYCLPDIMTLTIPFFIYLIGDTSIRSNVYSYAMSIINIKKSAASALFSTIQFSGSGVIVFLLMHIQFSNPLVLSIVFCIIGSFIFFASIILKKQVSLY
jgi:MFS transporter, DHA1 family, 2-module integral membrane pump EmrD